jgi:hypothetical protein
MKENQWTKRLVDHPVWVFLFGFFSVILVVGPLMMIVVLPARDLIQPVVDPVLFTPTAPRKTLPDKTFTPLSSSTSTSTSTTTVTATATPLPTITSTPTPLEGVAVIIGYSIQQRPLEVYRFGNGEKKRLIVAGIHGGYEANTIDLANELIVYLRDHPSLIPTDKSLYILPSLNPDGAAVGAYPAGRANANNVDINRNFDGFWVADWPRSGCWSQIYLSAGEEPFSESESRALRDFILSQNIEALISYHSAGLGIFAGGQPPDPDSESLAIKLTRASIIYPYPPVETGCLYTGQLIDWASLLGIAAVDLELANHWGTEFEYNLKVLEAFLTWEKPGNE